MTKIRIQTISNAISVVAASYFCIPSPPPLPSISFNIDAVLWLCQRGANVHALKNDGWDIPLCIYVLVVTCLQLKCFWHMVLMLAL